MSNLYTVWMTYINIIPCFAFKNTFIQFPETFSSALPKVADTTIFEIDDITYGADNNDVLAGTS